jgi:hypothetical protein
MPLSLRHLGQEGKDKEGLYGPFWKNIGDDKKVIYVCHKKLKKSPPPARKVIPQSSAVEDVEVVKLVVMDQEADSSG